MAKNILLVFTHPRTDSLNYAIFQHYSKWIEEAGFNLKTIDLYRDKFNPVLFYVKELEQPELLKQYQELILWAEHITFIYPIWWANMPAMLKGFFENVFKEGFSHRLKYRDFPEQLLKGKTATIIRTCGSPFFVKYLLGGDSNYNNIAKGILKVCGIKVIQTLSLSGVDMNSFNRKKFDRFLQKIKKSVRELQ
jgi:NAD(P)H dehydrogenase (quinone)